MVERPLAVVVLREGARRRRRARDHLAPSFAKFWLPDRFEFVDEIPKTAVGKFRKTALRERFVRRRSRESLGHRVGTYISTERRDAVALVSIDNPPMNALSSALLDELEAEVEALDADDAVRAIVLRGAGERAFVAGADIKDPLAPRVRLGGSARGIQRLGHRMDAARLLRRRDPRVLPRRRARAGAVLRHARLLGRRAGSGSPRSSSG